jgi:hypothetical protein
VRGAERQPCRLTTPPHCHSENLSRRSGEHPPLRSPIVWRTRRDKGVTAELTINRDAVGLALAELKKDRGDLEGAIDVVEQFEPTTYSAVSLAERYAQTGRWDDVVQLTEGLKNEDDAAASLRLPRAGVS